jgi:fatty acid synthase subunit beta
LSSCPLVTSSIPAVFRDHSIATVFEFGGQGLSYFAELKTLVEANPCLEALFGKIAARLKDLGSSSSVHRELPYGLDIVAWMKDDAPKNYLEKTAVAYPLSGLCQMLMYYSSINRAGVGAGVARKKCKSILGHSSGIVAAVVAAAATGDQHLEQLILDATTYLFWHGVHSQRQVPIVIKDPKMRKDGETPTPMLSVRGLPHQVLSKAVSKYNEAFKADEDCSKLVRLGLINGTDNCVCVGSEESLYAFAAALQRQLPPAKDSQARVPYSDRKFEYAMEYLKVTAPFHSPMLAEAVPEIMRDAGTSGAFTGLCGSDLGCAVWSTVDGADLREVEGPLLEMLCKMQAVEPLDWMKATSSVAADPTPTVIVDFGPGGKRGVAAFSAKHLAGRGVSFIHAAPNGESAALYPNAELLLANEVQVPKSWAELYAPKACKVGKDETLTIDNRMTRLLGVPPVVVGGMTPWSHYEQVGACNEAGYIAELAGGGIPLPHLFEKEIRNLSEMIPAGRGINCNLLFLNPYLWGFQFPMIEKLCKRGEPIDSVTVAAGVPGPDKAKEIVEACKRSGMRYISFKPGTADAIEQVLVLAKAHPDFYMVIQFTGGRAGGHHSFEDQYQPLLETYAKIRQYPNVMLVVGGGLGDADSAWTFLSGEWSLQFGRPRMPTDGVLLGARMTATKESRTCEQVKDLIVAAPGVEDQKDWELSYKGDAGGVMTVLSELGEPIHVINNRCARAWTEFDRRFFTKNGAPTTPDEMVALLEADRDFVIEQLNANYQKPWFGRKMTGEPCDLTEMTYMEVASRLVDLHWYSGDMEGRPGARWIDVSFRERAFDWLRRTEERFCEVSKLAMMTDPAVIETNPKGFLSQFEGQYPKAAESVLVVADVDYFHNSICGIPTRKPINFIPAISTMFKRYFKSDSLWYSEQVEAVPGYDAEKAFIISGPVAAKYIGTKEESVADVLNGIRDGVLTHIMKESPDVPVLRELPGIDDAAVDSLASAEHMEGMLKSLSATYTVWGEEAEIQLSDRVPSFDEWVALLSHTDHGKSIGGDAVAADGIWSGAKWLHSLMTFPRIQRGDRRAASFVPRIVSPMAGCRVTLKSNETDLLECSFHLPGQVSETVHLRYSPSSHEIEMTCTYRAPEEACRDAQPLTMQFLYQPQFRSAPIHEITTGRNERIRQFYTRVWQVEDSDESLTQGAGDEAQGTFTASAVISKDQVRQFCVEVGQVFETYVSQKQQVKLPIDFSIVACWRAMIRCVLSDSRIGSVDLVRLLHLENRFELLQPRCMVNDEDTFESTFSLVEIQNMPNGKRVTSQGTVLHENVPWCKVTSSFFIPWDVTSSDEVKASVGQEMEVITKSYTLNVEDLATLAVIQEKDFFKFETQPKVGDQLRVELVSCDQITGAQRSVDAFGQIFSAGKAIGQIQYRAAVKVNALVSFLDRTAAEYPAYKQIAGYEMLSAVDEVTAPVKLDRYSSISGDVNPIHTDPYLARLGGLEQPIVHGMWLSANARRVLATHVTSQEKCQTLSFRCSFQEKVMPGALLRTSLRHVGMRQGVMCIAFETVDPMGTVVCAGQADVEQPKCALTFTGQGSVRVGLGMDLYESSEVARKLWDDADKVFLDHYGLSLLDIVRNNPKEKTVHFGGPRGAKVRAFYMSLTRSTLDGSSAPLFPEISKSSTSFTFKTSAGLLFATQFTQPALIIAELAQYRCITQDAAIPPQFYFAGHSLGEYAAIFAVTDCIALPELLDLIFLRGMTMQSVVPRDKQHRSDYGMVAVDPTRVLKTMSAESLQELVNSIDKALGLCQIVNYNVEPTQYVVAGDLVALTALMHACNDINKSKSFSDMAGIVAKAVEQARADSAKAGDNKVALRRGCATIPLDGIDVPFHSRFLRSGVGHFRSILESKFSAEDMIPEKFEQYYIPNLVAKPFNLSRAFAEDVQSVADSPVLAKLLPDWEAFVAANKAHACATLIIELLAYQFASPVRWIETVEVMLHQAKVRRFCEIGPAPVNTNMFKAALLKNPKYAPLHGQVECLSYALDENKIYYKLKDQGPSATQVVKDILAASAPEEEEEVAADAPAPVAAAAPVAAPVAVAAPAAPTGGAEVDSPPCALDALRVIMAARFSKTVDAIDTSATIKKLSGGKSALQNEIVGDLGKEFADTDSSELEGAAEVALSQLAGTVQNGYKKLGKIMTDMANKMVSAKLPAGTTLSKLRTSFREEYSLGPLGVEGAMVAALVNEPSARLGEPATAAWRAASIKQYGDAVGQVVSAKGGAASAATGASEGATGVVDPKMAAKLKEMVSELAKVYRDYLGEDSLKDAKALEMEQGLRQEVDLRYAAVKAELGEEWINGVQPFFSDTLVREYNDWWAAARRDALILWHKLKQGEDASDLVLLLRNRVTPELRKLLTWLAAREQPASVSEVLRDLAAAPLVPVGTYTERALPTQPHVQVKDDGVVEYSEVAREGQPDILSYVEDMASTKTIFLGKPDSGFDQELSDTYFAALRDIVAKGISFEGKVALITGANPSSISAPVVSALLAGGCTVLCSFRGSKYDWFTSLYEQSAGAQARLICLPYNCGSQKDLDSVLEYVYDTLKLDVDYCFPFAALSENGRGCGDVDSKSELAHRIMLTNVIKLVGKVKACKADRNIVGKVCTMVVPLSPNRGDFGFDGLYSESKLGLASLNQKWSSEGLEDYISIVGANIGWTRGTGLMSANNQVSPGVEAAGMRTFTVNEMAFNLMGLLHPDVVALAQLQPVCANLTGGMDVLQNLSATTAGIRAQIADEVTVKKAIRKEALLHKALEEHGSLEKAEAAKRQPKVQPRAVPGKRFLFPSIPEAEKRERLGLRGMIDPASVVVITGFGEVGPWGNSTTRWEMEADGEFSVEGCIEMAWMMGLIKYFNGRMTIDGKPAMYNGWVDAKTNEPLGDWEIKSRFEKEILAHSGIRIVEPEQIFGHNPEKDKFYHQVSLQRDLDAVEVADEATAREFQKMHAGQADVFEKEGVWYVKIREGATIYVPRALRRDRWVAGQVPTGWDAKKFGIPDDIINQVDRVTLFSLVAFVEAMVASGITDPYEFYKYVHVSKVGNALGSGVGGMHAQRQMYAERKFGDSERVQGDVLQETFINTTAAWINMLLLSGSGPVKTPVGACATAMESFAIAHDTILSGQAKMMVVGAFDDISEETMLEFANMKATSNNDDEKAKGRPPREMCRPMTSTRAGFMESHGSGVHVLMAGDLAVDMGVPIYGVVGLVHTAMDREGRSVPAPGKGVLTVVSEAPSAKYAPTLQISYRRSQLQAELACAGAWKESAQAALDDDRESADEVEVQQRQQAVDEEYQRLVAAAKKKWGTEWWKGHDSISPLRGALASWGLTVDDIGMASCHGTSTKLNDQNESDILNSEMEALGRKEGNPLFVVTQKWLTGHPKGPASAWQVGGAMQAMLSGRVPGNRNLDNVDPALRQYKHLLQTSQTLEVGPLRAAVVTSFGFGQAGGQLLLVHPDYFLASLPEVTVEQYQIKRDSRRQVVCTYQEEVLAGRRSYVQVKNAAPYESSETKAYLMASDRRTGGKVDSLLTMESPSGTVTHPALDRRQSMYKGAANLEAALMEASGSSASRSVGVDVEPVSNPAFGKETFLDRNYTQKERDACVGSERSFAGLWAGKEAVVKALGNAGASLRSADAPLAEVELERQVDGSVQVHLHGDAAKEASRIGVDKVTVSLSYADGLAVAVAATM